MSSINTSSAETTPTFGKMTGVGKLKFVAKTLIFLVTFGFAFPTLFGE